ncbi:MAG: hypothetical protein LC131_00515 [Anaerolineae bacterium]|nr:hypothetical protein [Anaerolineae bacterium]
MSKRSANKDQPKVNKPSRYLTESNRRYWVRTAVVTAGLFAVIFWFNQQTRGTTTALLLATGIAGAILAYFVVSYFMFRRDRPGNGGSG